MWRIIVQLITALLALIGSKLMGITAIPVGVLFPELAKKMTSNNIINSNSKVQQISTAKPIDTEELENFSMGCGNKLCGCQSQEFSVSVTPLPCMCNNITRDVIEWQNERYQQHLRLKSKFKKAQTKQAATTQLFSNCINNGQQNESNNISNTSYDQLLNNDVNINDSSDILSNRSNCSFDNNTSIEGESDGIEKEQIRSPRNAYDNDNDEDEDSSNNNQNIMLLLEQNELVKQKIMNQQQQQQQLQKQQKQEEVLKEQKKNAFKGSLRQGFRALQQLPQQLAQQQQQQQNSISNKENNPTKNINASTQNQENENSAFEETHQMINDEVLKHQLHSYIDESFLQMKKLKGENSFDIHTHFDNYCSKKKCPCLKFKRRFTKMNPIILAGKKPLLTIFENLAY